MSKSITFAPSTDAQPASRIALPESLLDPANRAVTVTECDRARLHVVPVQEARADWGELEQVWAEDDFEGFQQAIQARLPLRCAAVASPAAAGARR